MDRKRAFSAALAAVAAITVAACVNGVDANRSGLSTISTDCHTRVIVTFAVDTSVDAIAVVARTAGVRLVVIERLLPRHYVLDLATDGADAACAAALARLRADPRVQSVELDARRAAHDGG